MIARLVKFELSVVAIFSFASPLMETAKNSLRLGSFSIGIYIPRYFDSISKEDYSLAF